MRNHVPGIQIPILRDPTQVPDGVSLLFVHALTGRLTIAHGGGLVDLEAAIPTAAAPVAAWDHAEAFTLVEGQVDYLFTGFTGASTTAANALVQHGLVLLEPDVDYLVLSDRLRLQSTPSAADAALGVNLFVRVYAADQGTTWGHVEAFTLIEGQVDYLFTGFSAADTNAANAVVQHGLAILEPDVDYLVQSDRVRLLTAPSADDVAKGVNLYVRVRRA